MTNRSPNLRASFAEGRCVRGTYIPSDQAAEITRSLSFTRPSRVLARFLADGGNPEMADAGTVELRSFSFSLGGADQRSDIITRSAPIYGPKTLEQMLSFVTTSNSGSSGKPDATTVDAFSSGNRKKPREAKVRTAQSRRGSFARTIYWGVHAFPATNAKDETRFIKFKIEPVGAEVTMTDEARTKFADVLNDDLDLRIAARDVRFSVMALLGRPGDPVTEVTIRWPDENERDAVRLGTIVITGVEANEVCDELVFNPANLAEGIGPPLDEIFAARCAVSQTRGC